MSLNCLTTADHLDGSALFTAAPFAFACRVNLTSIALGRRFMSLGNSSQSLEYLYLGLSSTSASGELACVASTQAGGASQAKSSVVPLNSWHGAVGNFVSALVRECELDGANKGTVSGTQAPAGLNSFVISGRTGDHFNGSASAIATPAVFSKPLSDVEKQYWGLGGGHPRAFQNIYEFWDFAARANTQVGKLRSLTLTATGTTLGATDPQVAPHFVGAPIGNLSLQQGQAITPIALAAAFEAMPNSPCTVSLWRVGAQTATTTTTATNGTGPTRTIPVASSAAFAAGDFATIGGGAKARVLCVLTTPVTNGQILVDSDQTFASGATVARLPAAASPVAGLGITSGSFGGTPTGTQLSTADYFFLATCNADPTNQSKAAASNRFAIAVAAIPVAPTFQVQPTITQRNPDGYTVAFTPSTNCTAYLGAYPEHATAPTIAQLKAGTGALAVLTKAITGADALTLTGLDFPTHDVRVVLNNAQGDSPMVALLDQLKAPPVGSAYRVLTSVANLTAYTANASVGDIEETGGTVAPSGALVTFSPDGHDAYTALGRQLRTARLYNKAARAWYLDDSNSQTYRIWYNNQPPAFTAPVDPYIISVGVAVAQDLTSLWSHRDRDPITVTVVDSLPANLTITNGQLNGTVVANSVGSYRVRGTDLSGDSTVGSIGIVAGKVRVPDLFSLDYHDAAAVDAATFLSTVFSFFDDIGPPNIVLGQDPLAGTQVDPRSIVTLTVSRTPPGTAPAYGLRRHSFQCVPYVVNGDLDMRHPFGT